MDEETYIHRREQWLEEHDLKEKDVLHDAQDREFVYMLYEDGFEKIYLEEELSE